MTKAGCIGERIQYTIDCLQEDGRSRFTARKETNSTILPRGCGPILAPADCLQDRAADCCQRYRPPNMQCSKCHQLQYRPPKWRGLGEAGPIESPELPTQVSSDRQHGKADLVIARPAGALSFLHMEVFGGSRKLTPAQSTRAPLATPGPTRDRG